MLEKKTYLLDFSLRSVSGNFEELDEPKVFALIGEPISFEGWLPIKKNISENNDSSLSVNVSVKAKTL